MKILHSIYVCLIFFCCLLLTGCPTGFEIKLHNTGSTDIKVIHDYEGKLFTTIQAGSSATFVQRSDCLRMNINAESLEFQLPIFPDNYVANKNSSPSVSMKLDKNMNLLALPIDSDNSNNFITLTRGCHE